MFSFVHVSFSLVIVASAPLLPFHRQPPAGRRRSQTWQLQHASLAIESLQKLSRSLRRSGEEVRLSSGRPLAELLSEAISGLQEVYPPQAATAASAPRPVRRRHQQQVRRWQHRAAKAQATSTDQPKINSRVTAVWCVRAGLSDPKHSLRSVSSYLADFADEAGQNPTCKTSVACIRDGFAETIIRLNRREVSEALLASGVSDTVCLHHVHDEASMRVRSSLQAQPAAGIRSRYSKVQNNCLRLCTAGRSLEVFIHLHALALKGTPNISSRACRCCNPM